MEPRPPVCCGGSKPADVLLPVHHLRLVLSTWARQGNRILPLAMPGTLLAQAEFRRRYSAIAAALDSPMVRSKTLTEMLSEEGFMTSPKSPAPKPRNLQCSSCSVQTCKSNDGEKAPAFCPTRTQQKILAKALDQYNSDPAINKIALAATHVTTHTMKNKWTRVEDTIEFAKSYGAKKIGIATCGGLLAESKILGQILTAKGFEIASISCKCGSVAKEKIGVPQADRGEPGKFEAICNPVAQAKLLNHEKTDLNILLGLCVGHDALFLQQAKAPTTVLVAKDRVTFHNPAAPLYGTQSYYRHLLKP